MNKMYHKSIKLSIFAKKNRVFYLFCVENIENKQIFHPLSIYLFLLMIAIFNDVSREENQIFKLILVQI